MVLFMDGSSSSKSYMVVARRGKIVLGLKPANIINGLAIKLPGNAVLVFNMRAAPMDDHLREVFEIGEKKVVSIDHALDHHNAFPEIEWSKKDDGRVSVAVYLPFKESLGDNKVAATMARLATSKEIEEALGKLLAKLGDSVVATPEELALFTREQLHITAAHVEAVEKQTKMTEEIAEAVSGEVLVGGAMTAKLKEIAKKYQTQVGGADGDEDDDGDAEVHGIEGGQV